MRSLLSAQDLYQCMAFNTNTNTYKEKVVFVKLQKKYRAHPTTFLLGGSSVCEACNQTTGALHFVFCVYFVCVLCVLCFVLVCFVIVFVISEILKV